MSYVQSIRDAQRALGKSKARVFQMSCNCGWLRRDERRYIEQRVERHFGYPDAEPWEYVAVTPVEEVSK